jgi:hypothetical protein
MKLKGEGDEGVVDKAVVELSEVVVARIADATARKRSPMRPHCLWENMGKAFRGLTRCQAVNATHRDVLGIICAGYSNIACAASRV